MPIAETATVLLLQSVLFCATVLAETGMLLCQGNAETPIGSNRRG